jgi:hypothetical protein
VTVTSRISFQINTNPVLTTFSLHRMNEAKRKQDSFKRNRIQRFYELSNRKLLFSISVLSDWIKDGSVFCNVAICIYKLDKNGLDWNQSGMAVFIIRDTTIFDFTSRRVFSSSDLLHKCNFFPIVSSNYFFVTAFIIILNSFSVC